MRAPGFFDLEERFVKLDELGDPLKKIADSVNREGFRAVPSDASSKPRKSKAGRKRGAKSPRAGRSPVRCSQPFDCEEIDRGSRYRLPHDAGAFREAAWRISAHGGGGFARSDDVILHSSINRTGWSRASGCRQS